MSYPDNTPESAISSLQREVESLRGALRRCRCIYCGVEFPFEEKDKLADHITSCEKSPMVGMVKDLESRTADYMDLVGDEFTRISALTTDTEIIGICQRAMTEIFQKEPVIKQRDDAVSKSKELSGVVSRQDETIRKMQGDLNQSRRALQKAKECFVKIIEETDPLSEPVTILLCNSGLDAINECQ